MRKFFILLALCAGIGPAAAQDRAAIEETIRQQLQAFNDRDVAEAWTFASPMIQGMFGTPENFGNMVRRGYPMVWDNTRPEFLELDGTGPEFDQEVYVLGPDGKGWVLTYKMVETAQGWKINGVSIVPAPDVAA